MSPVGRAGAVAALVLALSAPVPRAEAMSATGTSRAGASIDFRVVVPSTVIARTTSQIAALSISAEDVARGYVDLDGATSLRLTANDDAGYGVAVMFDPSLLSRVLVHIQQQTVGVDSPGMRVHLPARKMIDTPMRIGYRLYLAAGAKPGRYRWPVALRFEAVP